MKYYVLENTGDPVNRRVHVVASLEEAHKIWFESPIKRTIVKEVELRVVEK